MTSLQNACPDGDGASRTDGRRVALAARLMWPQMSVLYLTAWVSLGRLVSVPLTSGDVTMSFRSGVGEQLDIVVMALPMK